MWPYTTLTVGQSSPAASIAYLNASVIYLASVLGDSLLLRIQRDGRLETLDSFKNVAPIRDAILADLDESGEPSIVTCSGQGNSGGLRVIRNGVDVKELATIDGVEGIRRTFTIRDPNIRLVLLRRTGAESDSISTDTIHICYCLSSLRASSSIYCRMHHLKKSPSKNFPGLVVLPPPLQYRN